MTSALSCDYDEGDHDYDEGVMMKVIMMMVLRKRIRSFCAVSSQRVSTAVSGQGVRIGQPSVSTAAGCFRAIVPDDGCDDDEEDDGNDGKDDGTE